MKAPIELAHHLANMSSGIGTHHRIINDRMEKYESYIVFISKWHCRNEEFLSRWQIDSTLLPYPPPPHTLVHPPTTPIPYARLDVGNGGGQRVCQGNTSLANITTMVEMQSKPLPLTPVCPICLLFILFSILSFIILWSLPSIPTCGTLVTHRGGLAITNCTYAFIHFLLGFSVISNQT